MTVTLPKLPDHLAKPALAGKEYEWTATGSFVRDTSFAKAFDDQFSRNDEFENDPLAIDPYNNAKESRVGASSSSGTKRRTLDDMRRLSEEIKAKRRDPDETG